MTEVATVALSGLLGAVTGFLAAFLRSALDVRVKVDEQLRGTRTPVYRKLWRETRIVPLWPPNETLTYGDLQRLSERFRDWYFEGGGIYLSRTSQSRYQAVQKLLRSLAAMDETKRVDPESDDYHVVQAACSRLRTAMTDDLLSRRGRGALFASPIRRRRRA